jgi:hypothetical protein
MKYYRLFLMVRNPFRNNVTENHAKTTTGEMIFLQIGNQNR